MRKARARDCWISEPGFRHYFTDADGVDHDIVNVIKDLRMAKILLGAAGCPDSDCDEGIVHRNGEWHECQWCDEKSKLLEAGGFKALAAQQ